MSEIKQFLAEMESRGPVAAAELLPIVYRELRNLAAAKLASERPGHTLNATALVHEAYLRLVGGDDQARWSGRGHFFAAAAEAMRRILVESARHKNRLRHGGGKKREELADQCISVDTPHDEVLAVHEALDSLGKESPLVAELVKLHYFAGLTIEESASVLGIPERSAYRDWAYARAWLHRTLSDTKS